MRLSQAWEFFFLRPLWRQYLQPFARARHQRAVASLRAAVRTLIEAALQAERPADCFLDKMLEDEAKGKMNRARRSVRMRVLHTIESGFITVACG